jgi:hypothetical protein
MDFSIPAEQLVMRDRVRQFVEEELNPIITNGDCANVFTTIAVTDEDKGARGGFTAFIIENDFPGFSVGPPDKKNGQAVLHGNGQPDRR